jgi:hypothetical protein
MQDTEEGENSSNANTWPALYHLNYIFFVFHILSLWMFSRHTQKLSTFTQLSVNNTKHVLILDSSLLTSTVFLNWSIQIAIAKTVHKLHVHVFFICRFYWHVHCFVQKRSNGLIQHMHNLTSMLARVLQVSSLPFDHVHACLHMCTKTTDENIRSPVLTEDWIHVHMMFVWEWP